MITYPVPKIDIEIGDVIVFDGDGLLFKCLTKGLSCVDPYYKTLVEDAKTKKRTAPWHVGIITLYRKYEGFILTEATGEGIQNNPINIYDPSYYTIYPWFKESLDKHNVLAWVTNYVGKPYDVKKYIWTIIGVIAEKKFHKNFGDWKNDSYLCWEVLTEFCSDFGQPIVNDEKTYTISDIMQSLNGVKK